MPNVPDIKPVTPQIYMAETPNRHGGYPQAACETNAERISACNEELKACADADQRHIAELQSVIAEQNKTILQVTGEMRRTEEKIDHINSLFAATLIVASLYAGAKKLPKLISRKPKPASTTPRGTQKKTNRSDKWESYKNQINVDPTWIDVNGDLINFFSYLQIPPATSWSADLVKNVISAHKKQATTMHPDRCPDELQKIVMTTTLQRINLARAVLTDSVKFMDYMRAYNCFFQVG